MNWKHWAVVGVIILALVQSRASKVPMVFDVAPDAVASHSWDTYLKDAEKQGIAPLWNPYIFCGMPGFASITVTGKRHFDISSAIIDRIELVTGVVLFETIANPLDIFPRYWPSWEMEGAWTWEYVVASFFAFSLTLVYSTMHYTPKQSKNRKALGLIGLTLATPSIFWLSFTPQLYYSPMWVILLIVPLIKLAVYGFIVGAYLMRHYLGPR